MLTIKNWSLCVLFCVSVFSFSQIIDECNVCLPTDTVGDFRNVSLKLGHDPLGNPFPTNTAFAVTGKTEADYTREFLCSIGLISDRGAKSSSTPFRDKVSLYVANVAEVGSGDVWAINPLISLEKNSGEYNAQGIELDLDNKNANRGESDGAAGLAPPIAYGLSVSGSGSYRSTAAVGVMGPDHRIWNRGIVFANDCVEQSTFQDLGNPLKSIDIRGDPEYGIYQSSTNSKNYFAGKVGIGDADPEVALNVNGDVSVSGRYLFSRSSRNGVVQHYGVSSFRDTYVLGGNALLDDEGIARVAVEDENWLGSLCPKFGCVFRYYMTPILVPMPNLHVAREIHISRGTLFFTIGGGLSKGKVSWEISVTWQPK